MEIWKDIKGHEGYYMVSNKARVKSVNRTIMQGGVPTLHKGKVLKQVLRNGYTSVGLYPKGCAKTIHRLVALAFIPNPDNKPQINHKNGIRHDNRIENLEWTTQKENMQHAYRVLKSMNTPNLLGEEHGYSKLTNDQVRHIKSSDKSGLELARECNVSPSNISSIRTGKTWKHIN